MPPAMEPSSIAIIDQMAALVATSPKVRPCPGAADKLGRRSPVPTLTGPAMPSRSSPRSPSTTTASANTVARRCQSRGARSSGMPTIASPAAPTTTASTRKLPNAASTPATAASIDAPPRSRRRSSIFGCRAWLAAGWENSNKDVSRQIECVNDPVQEVGWHPPGCPVSTAGKRPSAPSRPPYGSRGGPRQGRLALDPLLVFQAETGEWALFQARGLDRPAAGLADPVGALLQPLESRLDLPELGLHLLQDGDVLLVLEDLRPDVGGVLVVVGQLADAGEIRRRLGVAPQVALHAQQALALRFEPRADLALVPTRPSTNSGRDRGPPYRLTRWSGTLDLR